MLKCNIQNLEMQKPVVGVNSLETQFLIRRNELIYLIF